MSNGMEAERVPWFQFRMVSNTLSQKLRSTGKLHGGNAQKDSFHAELGAPEAQVRRSKTFLSNDTPTHK